MSLGTSAGYREPLVHSNDARPNSVSRRNAQSLRQQTVESQDHLWRLRHENTTPTPTIGIQCPDHRCGHEKSRTNRRGSAPRPLYLNRLFRAALYPDYQAPSKNLPSGARILDVTTKAQALPAHVLLALFHAERTPGWNNRSANVRRFDVNGCALIVVPARVWVYRRRPATSPGGQYAANASVHRLAVHRIRYETAT